MTSAGIISIGTELIEGRVQDTHGKFLSSQLRLRGLNTLYTLLLPDNPDIVAAEVSRMIGKLDVIILTGGLGPTADDITREVVAEVSGSKLVFQQDLWESIRKRFTDRRNLPESNKKQAHIPQGFQPIENERGTAPGFWGSIECTLVFCLPGPPRELKPMFTEKVLPLIAGRLKISTNNEGEMTCSIFMVSESHLEQVLQDLNKGSLTWGTQIDEDRIVLILNSDDRQETQDSYDSLSDVFGRYRVRPGNISPAQSLYEVLLKEGKTVSAAESCTGGYVSKLMTDIPGSSTVFSGGCVTYSNDAKSKILGIRKQLLSKVGAVSREVVSAMALGATSIFDSDFGLGISGIAGPKGGTREKPVGTVWIGVADSTGDVKSQIFHFFGSREQVRKKASITALIMMERFILAEDELDIIEKW